MIYRTLEMTNPGDFINHGHLGQALFANEKNGDAKAWHLHSVTPCKFEEGVPVSWAVTTCQKD